MKLTISTVANNRLAVALLLGFLVLLIYLQTLAVTVTFRDSGDFISSAYSLGIPHPPGYPLYTMLAKLFTFVPFGSVARRVALLSTVFSVASTLMLYMIVLELTGAAIPALLAGLALAFSRTFWSQGVIAETFSLNMFFIGTLILALLKWEKETNNRYLYIFAFLYGLSLTNHYTPLLLAPAFLFFILDTRLGVVNRKTVPLLAAIFLLPLLLYLYEPIRAAAHPVKNWGDPHTLQRFFDHVTLQQYSSIVQSFPTMLYLNRLLRYGATLREEFALPLSLLSIPGLLYLYSRSKKHFLFFLMLFLSVFLLASRNTEADQYVREHHYIPTYFVVAFWIGLGLARITLLFEKYRSKRRFFKALGIMCPALLLLVLLPLSQNYEIADKSNYYFAYDYGMNMLSSLRPNAILIATDDNNGMPVEYLQYVEKKRPDVIVVIEPLLRFEWYREELRRRGLEVGNQHAGEDHLAAGMVSKYIARRPIYFTKLSDYLSSVYRFNYQGLVFRLQRLSATTDTEVSLKPLQLTAGDRMNMHKDADVQWAFSQPYVNLGRLLTSQGQFRRAEDVLQEAGRLYPLSTKVPYSLAILYLNEKKPDSAIPLLKRLLKMDSAFGLAYERLSYAYMLKNDFPKAVEATRKAIMFFPRNPILKARLGAIYLRGGWNREAEIELKKALQIAPDYSDAHYFLAQLYELQNRKAEAIREWRFLARGKEKRYTKTAEERLRLLKPNR